MPTQTAAEWLALKSRIDTLAPVPAMPVYDPLATFTPPSNANGPQPFILVGDVRLDMERISIGKVSNGRVMHRRAGILMLTIQWPVALAVTHAQLMQAGGVIADHFTADQRMKYGETCLRVTRDPDVMQPYLDGVYRLCVVRIPWSSV